VIAFVDSSVLLRLLLGEPRPLREWRSIRTAYASRILVVEVGRVIDRMRLAGDVSDEEVATLHVELRRVLASIAIVPVTEKILARAQGPMPTALGTLDAIHLACALEVASALEAPPVLATHDAQLARAAQASGLTVCGIG
jgi:predicted nucleic acid-binding protein